MDLLEGPFDSVQMGQSYRRWVTEYSQYRMTTVDLNNLSYADEPFVLSNDAAQVSM